MKFWKIYSVLVLLVSCSSPTQEVRPLEQQQNHVKTELPHAFRLLKSTCFSCHSPNPNFTGGVAPTLADIKQTYKSAYQDEDQFYKAIKRFLDHPTQENTILKGAVEQYGLMPQMSLRENQIKSIASYLYQNNVEDSIWFVNQYPKEENALKQNLEVSYIEKGFEYAMATKSVLGKNLKQQLKAKGSLGALEFCNLKAIHLTDSVKNTLGVDIKRVSDKPRNPNNQANVTELGIIEQFKITLDEGKSITPLELEDGNTVKGYYPIVTNGMCMQCHGNSDQIKPATQEKLKTLYPQDRAKGYSPNQLRGLWVVTMDK